MEAVFVLGLGVVLLVLALALAIAVIVSLRTESDQRALELEARATSALEESLPPGVGTHLERPLEVRAVHVIDERPENPTYVPVVRVPLGTADTPGMGLVFEYVAAVLATIHPVFAEEHDRIRRYDVEFTFGPNGLLVSGSCHRVSVPLDLAERVVDDSRYRARDLHRDVKARADEEKTDEKEGTSAVLWEEC